MATPWPEHPPSADDLAAFADAEPRPYWSDALGALPAMPALRGVEAADLCIVGAGFTGLWAALHAKRQSPDRDVVVLEAETAGFGASGRNGGIIKSSLTHGLSNGLARFRDEMPAIERLAATNFGELRDDLERLGIDCDYEANGFLRVLHEPGRWDELDAESKLLRSFNHEVEVFGDAEAIQAEVASPLFCGGLWVKSGAAIVHPGKLAAGLRQAALDAGVRLFEHTPVAAIEPQPGALEVIAAQGRVRAQRVVLATSAFTPLLPSIRRRIIPVYDYVLMSEPLSADQKAAIGWRHRQSITDSANQFHYFRLTADDRILWGGYDAIYRYNSRVGAQLDDHQPTFAKLSQHFFTAFPQLRGLRFTHRWGGAIDTCSRFTVFFGTAHRGRLSYAVGYTGLGVGATRFAAQVALDLADGRQTEATWLRFVQRRPVPFPPEPLRCGVVQLTRNRLAAADRKRGRRGLWLRTLDRLGVGFDS